MRIRKYNVEIDYERKIINEVRVGKWNSLDVYYYNMDYLEEIAPNFRGEPWSKIVHLNKWLPSKDVVTALANYLSWATGLGGMRYVAYVSIGSYQRGLLNKILEIAYAEEVSEIFSNSEEANFWLKSKGF